MTSSVNNEKFTNDALGVKTNEEAARKFSEKISEWRELCGGAIEEAQITIEKLVEAKKQSEEQAEIKKAIFSAISESLETMSSKTFLLPIGSTYNGCASSESDLDLMVVDASETRTDKIDFMKEIRKKICKNQECKSMFVGVKNIMHCNKNPKGYSLLKMETNRKHGSVKVDVVHNVKSENITNFLNSRLTFLYTQLSPHLVPLIIAINDWAANNSLKGAMKRKFNSHTINLMVIHFLQCGVVPPTLPNAQHLLKEHEFILNPKIALYEHEVLPFVPTNLPECQPCQFTTAELLIGFFIYYNNFDFENKTISVRSGSVIAKCDHQYTIHCEEPFDTDDNTARAVDEKCLYELKQTIGELVEEWENHNFDFENQFPQPWFTGFATNSVNFPRTDSVNLPVQRVVGPPVEVKTTEEKEDSEECEPCQFTTAKLLIGFFIYYNNFDFENRTISVRSGSVIAKCDHHYPVLVEEPFDTDDNTARAVDEKCLYELKQKIGELVEECENHNFDFENQFSQSWFTGFATNSVNVPRTDSVNLPVQRVVGPPVEVKTTEEKDDSEGEW